MKKKKLTDLKMKIETNHVNFGEFRCLLLCHLLTSKAIVVVHFKINLNTEHLQIYFLSVSEI